MRLKCNLRGFRGDRSLRQMGELTGISAGLLSLIERGRLLPRDVEVPRIEEAYGARRSQWYHPDAGWLLETDEVRS